MKKFIVLFAAAACLTTTSQAQTQNPKITKVFGIESTRLSSSNYLNLETDTMFYSRGVTGIRNLQFYVAFEVTNGDLALKAGDTITVRGRIGSTGNTYFPKNDSNKYFYELAKDLAAGDTITIYMSQGAGFYEKMDDYSNLWAEIYADSAYSLDICGQVLYATGYTITSATISQTQLCAKSYFFKSRLKVSLTEPMMDKVKFYPNPVSSDLKITNLKDMSVEVYNIVGQQIIRHENVSGDISIAMENYPDGIYFVKLQNGKSVRTEKIKLVK